MDWVEGFYSTTGKWWQATMSGIDEVDRFRAEFVERVAPSSVSVLELGCGHGTTAACIAASGRDVIGVDLSERVDSADFTAVDPGSLRFQRTDFYTVEFDQVFDVVCYWDGFGVGTDADQVRLLDRISKWLADDDGVAIIEVFHPSGWELDSGLEEIKEPVPERGLTRRLGHRRGYDIETGSAQDTWWEVGKSIEWTQVLRCYRPPRFAELAGEAGLRVVACAGTASVFGGDLDSPIEEPCWSYICVLQRQ